MTTASLFRALCGLAIGWFLITAEWIFKPDARALLPLMLQVIGASLVLVVVTHVLYRRGALRRRSKAGTPPTRVVEIEGDPEIFMPGLGQAMFAVGATLLLGQVWRGPAVGGIVLGLIFLAIGSALLVRVYLRIDPVRQLHQGRHLFGIPFRVTSIPVPRPTLVRLEPQVTHHNGRQNVRFVTTLEDEETAEARTLAVQGSHTEARRLAKGLAEGLVSRFVDHGTPEEAP